MPLISFIIITRNRIEKLTRCINSIQVNANGAAVIIIDNGSHDRTASLEQTGPLQKIVHLRKNIGVAPARNLGLSLAKKEFDPEFFVFLDDDAYVEKISVHEIEKAFRENPDLGIIAPLILYPSGEVQESLRTFPTLKALMWRGFGLYKLYKPSFYLKYTHPRRQPDQSVDWAIGACLIFKKEVFEKVGNFDEHYYFGYEDADICRRALRHKLETMYNPRIIIRHDYARTSARLLHPSAIRHFRSILRFMAHV